jgi:hypothetical protein
VPQHDLTAEPKAGQATPDNARARPPDTGLDRQYASDPISGMAVLYRGDQFLDPSTSR